MPISKKKSSILARVNEERSAQLGTVPKFRGAVPIFSLVQMAL